MRKNIFTGLVLAVILGFTIYTRIILPMPGVFKDGMVLFNGPDPYVHMMMAEYSYDNFPKVMTHNDYMGYPDGRDIAVHPLMSWTIALISRIISVDVNVVGAYFPAICMILLLIPVFITGWLLFGRWAALVGTLLAVFIPGELVGRSVLGATDQHIVEVLLATTMVMFLVLAFKKHWLWFIGAGISLALYNLNWIGAPLLTMMLFIYMVVAYAVKIRAKEPVEDFTKIMGGTLAMGSILYLAIYPTIMLYNVFYVAVMLIPVVFYGLHHLLHTKPWYAFVLAILVTMAGLMGIGFLVIPEIMTKAVGSLGGLVSPSSTIMEMAPLFMIRGKLTGALIWTYFGFSIIIAIIALWLYLRWKDRDDSRILYITWTIFALIITMLQCRFAYYSVINVALLAGYGVVWIAEKVSISEKKVRIYKGKNTKDTYKITHREVKYDVMGFVLVIALLFLVAPVYKSTINSAKANAFAMPDSWVQTIKWINEKTPSNWQTWGEFPLEKYSILTWWDFGYWITKEAKRIVVCDPGGGHQWEVARYLMDNNGELSEKVADQYNVRYVIIFYPMVTGMFEPIHSVSLSKYQEPEVNFQPDKALVAKLYFERGGYSGYKKVFESTQMYKGQPEIKVFERIKAVPCG